MVDLSTALRVERAVEIAVRDELLMFPYCARMLMSFRVITDSPYS